jgi:hypothetical protein
MFNLENAYVYESERRKDEMRAAADSQVHRHLKRQKSPARLVALLGVLAWLVTTFMN